MFPLSSGRKSLLNINRFEVQQRSSRIQEDVFVCWRKERVKSFKTSSEINATVLEFRAESAEGKFHQVTFLTI